MRPSPDRDGLDRCAREWWILQSPSQPPNACAKADTPTALPLELLHPLFDVLMCRPVR